MGKFIITYGLSGGFGGADNCRIIDEDTLDEASSYAYEGACGVYEDYSGLYGLRTLSEVLEELQEEYPEATEEDAFEIYNEERESWLDYSAEEYTEEAFESYSEEFSDIIDETKD